MEYSKVVAIDGPSGSGKSTLAKQLARELKFVHFDTGAMYRALALGATQKNIAFDNEKEMSSFLEEVNFEYGKSEDELVLVDNKNLTKNIREHHVSELASEISQIENVRSYLVDFQRAIAKNNFCVMEGRDIGTVVFPKSFCKIYLTADPKVRAQRRLAQLSALGETNLKLDAIIEDVVKRDHIDMSRKISPLKKADDAFELVTDDLNESQVLGELIKIVKDRAAELGFNI